MRLTADSGKATTHPSEIRYEATVISQNETSFSRIAYLWGYRVGESSMSVGLNANQVFA